MLFYSGYGYAYGGYPYSYGARFIGKRSTDAEPEAGVQNYGAYELYFLFVWILANFSGFGNLTKM